jgi:hypothetical protein
VNGQSQLLASTGIHCLVAEVPLALRNHIFVPASFGENGADEYQELDETEAHWTNIEILRNHCKVYGLEQEGAAKELQERIQRSMAVMSKECQRWMWAHISSDGKTGWQTVDDPPPMVVAEIVWLAAHLL